MNDWSARDLQMVEMQGPLGPCKGKDSAITLGPWLVTADELPELASGGPTPVNLSVTVNDVPFGEAPLGSMGGRSPRWWPTPLAARFCKPGKFSGRGPAATAALPNAGAGSVATSVAALRPGDVVTLDGGPLGTVSNRIVAGVPVRQGLERRKQQQRR